MQSEVKVIHKYEEYKGIIIRLGSMGIIVAVVALIKRKGK